MATSSDNDAVYNLTAVLSQLAGAIIAFLASLGFLKALGSIPPGSILHQAMLPVGVAVVFGLALGVVALKRPTRVKGIVVFLPYADLFLLGVLLWWTGATVKSIYAPIFSLIPLMGIIMLGGNHKHTVGVTVATILCVSFLCISQLIWPRPNPVFQDQTTYEICAIIVFGSVP